jgi:hypothetical protein
MQVDVDSQETRESLEAIEAVVEHDGAVGFCPTYVSPCGPGGRPARRDRRLAFLGDHLGGGDEGPPTGQG